MGQFIYFDLSDFLRKCPRELCNTRSDLLWDGSDPPAAPHSGTASKKGICFSPGYWCAQREIHEEPLTTSGRTGARLLQANDRARKLSQWPHHQLNIRRVVNKWRLDREIGERCGHYMVAVSTSRYIDRISTVVVSSLFCHPRSSPVCVHLEEHDFG